MKSVPLLEAVEDVSSGNVKIPQSALLPRGELPVVDQGRSLVAGYTDDLSARLGSSPPVIVFGDHTRALKFVDFPFAMGADGVKVLKVRDGFDAKFVYHALRSIQINSAGYSRHFKFLKQVMVPALSLDEQRRIAAILDRADALCTKRRQVLAHLDTLTQSIYRTALEGEDSRRVSAGEVMPDLRNGLSPSSGGAHFAKILTLSAITQGRFDPEATKTGKFAVAPGADKRVRSGDFLICRGNGNRALVGAGVYSDSDRPDLVFPDTVIAGRVDRSVVLLPVLAIAWRQPEVRRQVEALARTTNGTYKVNQRSIGSVEVPIPQMSVQRALVSRFEQIEVWWRRVDLVRERADELFASLQARAFAGEL